MHCLIFFSYDSFCLFLLKVIEPFLCFLHFCYLRISLFFNPGQPGLEGIWLPLTQGFLIFPADSISLHYLKLFFILFYGVELVHFPYDRPGLQRNLGDVFSF